MTMARTKKTLWEINQQIVELKELLTHCTVEDNVLVDVETGETFPLDILDAANKEHEEKMKNCLYVFKNHFASVEAALKAQRDLHYAEIDAINAKIERNKIDKKNFGNYLSYCTQGQKWHDENNTFSCWTQEDASTEIINEEYIPAKFFSVKVDRIPDKDKIKAALKAGEYIKGAKLVLKKSFRAR